MVYFPHGHVFSCDLFENTHILYIWMVFLLMNWCHICSHRSFYGVAILINCTFERFLLLMNWCHMCSHRSFYGIAKLTKFTLEWFVCSWTNVTCVFMRHFLNQVYTNKFILWMVSFDHELIPHGISCNLYDYKCSHKFESLESYVLTNRFMYLRIYQGFLPQLIPVYSLYLSLSHWHFMIT